MLEKGTGKNGCPSEMAAVAKANFNRQFWNEDAQCLYDVIHNDERDALIRPDQIFAVSLTHSLVEQDRARKIVDKVEAELLTAFGLHSLSPKDPKYIPIFAGSSMDRDAAYHQGTVWAWLIGRIVEA